jgi:hypothetical protein
MPILRLCLLSIITFSLFSCGDYTDEEPIPENNASITFGIRHDKNLSDYELIATNEGEFSSSAYPSFAPIVKFCYTLDGSTGIDYVGTGTLVAPQWILTAGHNFLWLMNKPLLQKLLAFRFLWVMTLTPFSKV